MTLAISYFDPNVEDQDEAFRGLAQSPSDLFGWESWRGVWGSDEMRRRGSTFLVQLRDSDLHVYPEELGLFRDELESIFSAAHDIARALEIEEEGLRFRLRNALGACAHAEQHGWAVSIS